MSSADLPPETAGRLRRPAFSSGLTVPDFAACLQMGLRPVGLVQGYCVDEVVVVRGGLAVPRPRHFGAAAAGEAP